MRMRCLLAQLAVVAPLYALARESCRTALCVHHLLLLLRLLLPIVGTQAASGGLAWGRHSSAGALRLELRGLACCVHDTFLLVDRPVSCLARELLRSCRLILLICCLAAKVGGRRRSRGMGGRHLLHHRCRRGRPPTGHRAALGVANILILVVGTRIQVGLAHIHF